MIDIRTKKSLSLFAAVVVLLLISFKYGYSQGPGMPGGPDYDPDKEVPVDGGLGILLAAALAYGVKKINRGNL